MPHFLSVIFFIFSIAQIVSAADIQYLGNPYTKQYQKGGNIYARNIWDMQLYQDKIYLGAGNSSNHGPAKNAGRVYVVSFDPKTEKFHYEYKVAEEQIDIFKVYGDVLYIPGHDATQKWDFGNIYMKKEGNWEKYRTLANALHVYDLVVKDDNIYTAIGLKGDGAVFISDMSAKNWRKIKHGQGRVYGFLELSDNIFATKTFRKKQPQKLTITQWFKDGDTFSARFDLNINKMFPDTDLDNTAVKITRTIKMQKGAFYLGAYKHNDHQSKPFGLYFIDSNLQVKKIKLNQNDIPRDLLLRDGKVYLLLTNKNQIKVNTVDPNTSIVSDYLNFDYPTFARSFEEYDGCFYFGMGSEVNNPIKWSQDELLEQTGDIVKICK